MFDIKQYCLVPPPYGGVTVYVSRLIKRLNDDGLSAGGFYSSENNDEEIRRSPLFDKFNYNPNANKIKRIIGHLRRIKAVLPYRIIHFHGVDNMALPWMLKEIFKKRIVVTVHSAMIVEFYYSTRNWNRFFFRKLATSDTHWIAVSEQAKEELLKLPFSFSHEITVIPAYIPVGLSESEMIPISMSEYVAKHKKTISFYGRSFMIYQGHDVYGLNTIIELYSRIIEKQGSNIGLIFCLSDCSDSSQINELHQFAKEKGVDDLIYWQIGPLDSLQPLWSCTDVYVRPTYTDGDSVAIREALDAGVFVVASDVCARPEEVIIYEYDNMNDLELKCINALQAQHTNNHPKKDFYAEMKSIYNSLLH